MQLKKNNDTLRSKISSMAHQIECLETVISSLKSTNKNLEVQIVAHKDEIDHFKGKHKNYCYWRSIRELFHL